MFKLKKDELGAVIKHKAQLVVRGFVQQEGIDYDDAFAPVARMESVRVLLALVAQEVWQVSLDVRLTKADRFGSSVLQLIRLPKKKGPIGYFENAELRNFGFG